MPTVEDGQADHGETVDHHRRFVLFQAIPAWMISMLLHMFLLLLMALLTVAEPQTIINILSMSTSGEAEAEMEQFTLEDALPADLSEADERSFDEPAPTPMPMTEVKPVEVSQPIPLVAISTQMMDMVSTVAPSRSLSQSLSSFNRQELGSRAGKNKKELLKRFGGTDASEAAVAKALHWLSIHQLANGAWTFAHTVVCRGRDGCDGLCDQSRARAFNGATALGILPFLGAGQTHMEGKYRKTVAKGLLFLAANGERKDYGGLPCLDLSENGGNMYSHGLASIALCEAYAMTGDPALLEPAQMSLNYIAYAQNPRDGGWRYAPQDPTGGDTSVTGWQIMALKSGHMGHLIVPPQVTSRANVFLDLASSENGTSYRYQITSGGTGQGTPCQPIGLLCRMYMGTDKSDAGLVAGVQDVASRGVIENDIYYNYYAAQVLRHFGGSQWDTYNSQLRDWLVESQATTGHSEGSWHWPDSKAHRGPIEGGRLCSTAIATMILEVYYRHMPLYNDAASDEEFPL